MKKLIALSVLNLAVSGGTLAIVLLGAKKVDEQVTEVKEKTNTAVRAMKRALEDLGEL